ncbi:MAG: energy-coupling factor ABC transporter ATP-binding protein [Candidatus Brocadiia bacterium]
MSEPLVALRDIRFAYEPQRPVLEGLDFQLEPRERVGLLGPTGSGKTTLLHLVVGLLRPGAGTVEVFGRERRAEADFLEVRRRAGLLFQDPDDQLFCPTVAEDVAFGPLNLGRSRDEVQALVARTLDALGLGAYGERVTYKLSGGEKRLVSLATVLAMEPDVLLLDEPTSGLDEDSERRLLDILLGLPLAMVVVSHDRRFVARIATRSLRLRGGRLHPAAGPERGDER